MGPRSADRGIEPLLLPIAEKSLKLQWGRDQLIAELSRSIPHVRHRIDRFNGAAIS